MKKVGILSLGCPRNVVDSEEILSRLLLKGYSIVDIDKAETAIVNTCSFIDEAKRESIDVILDLIEAKKAGRLKRIIVYGCLSARYKDELVKELPEVDAFVGKVTLSARSKRTVTITPSHYGYLKICEGCVNNCSFCVIPKIKGKFNSLDMESVLKKVRAFSKSGISELNIIGQDISGYGIDLYGAPKLAPLLEKIALAAKNIHWLRLLYLNPSRVSDDLLKVIKNEPKFCKYIDLPIQHINNRILKLMNRQSSRKEILSVLERARKLIPGVSIRTSVIVGFPTETDKEFKELLDFIEEAKFERLGAFIYSREEGTAAYNLEGQISKKIKSARFDAVMLKQQEVSRQVNEKFLGKTIEVLIDEEENGQYLARSQYDAPEVDGMVYVNSKKKLSSGEFVDAKIIDTLEYDLVGEAL